VKPGLSSAILLFKRGMTREAANMLYSLRSEAENKKDLYKLSAVNFYLCEYYGRKRDVANFNSCLRQYNNIYRAVKKSGFKNFPGNSAGILYVRYCILNAQKYFIHENFKPNINKIIKYYNRAHEASAGIKNNELYFRVLATLAQIYRVQGDLSRSGKYIKEGIKEAKNNKLRHESLLFRMHMLELLFRENPAGGREYLHEAEGIYYRYVSLQHPNADYLVRMVIVLSRFYTYYNVTDKLAGTDAKLLEYFNIFGFKNEYHNRRYLYYSDIYFDNIIVWKKNPSPAEGMPSLSVDVDSVSLAKLERLNSEILYCSIPISRGTLGIAYLNRIEIEFWKGKGCDFIEAGSYFKKINRLLRSRLFFTVKSLWMKTNKLLMKILEDSFYKPGAEIYEQHFPEIKDYFRSLKHDTEGVNILIEYAKILFASEVLDHDEFRRFAGSFEKWLLENRRELIGPVLKNLGRSLAA
jgi:hypothetical protein